MVVMNSVRTRQGNTTLYVGSLSLIEFLDIDCIVDRWDPSEGWSLESQGYQRELFDDHIQNIQNFLLDGLGEILPTSIIATIRDVEPHQSSFTAIDGDLGHLTILPGCHLYIIDGQHRILGMEKLLERNPGLGDFRFPVVIIDHISKVEELRQFFLINERQRRIQSNLAFALLGIAAKDNPELARSLTKKGEEWKLTATSIAIALNETSNNSWYGRVRYPGDTGDSGKIATLNSLASSIEKFLKNHDDILIDAEEIIDYLSRFWNALSGLMVSAFENPATHVIQRGVGSNAVNHLAYEIYRQRPDLRSADEDELRSFLRQAEEFFQVRNWQRGSVFVQGYLGSTGPKNLAREILVKLDLEPRWPRQRIST